MLNVNRRRRSKGFTLIELLIVVAIIGIIAAILIPNLIDALQKAKQKRTVGDERNVGTAWMSWLTDQVGAAAAGQAGQYNLGNLNSLNLSTVEAALIVNSTFFYIEDVPAKDGWGNSYDYFLGTNLLAGQVMAIRSSGNDAQNQGQQYTIGPFIATQYEQDIVWADGFFVRFPAGVKVQ